MKTAKYLLAAVLLAAVVYGFGLFFLSQLTTGAVSSGPAGVILAPPPDVVIEERGELDRAQAAGELAGVLARHSGEVRVGIHFRSAGQELYWIADRSEPGAAVLLERSGGAAGTRLETRWQGALGERLAWAEEHGTFDAPGLPPGERQNLYH